MLLKQSPDAIPFCASISNFVFISIRHCQTKKQEIRTKDRVHIKPIEDLKCKNTAPTSHHLVGEKFSCRAAFLNRPSSISPPRLLKPSSTFFEPPDFLGRSSFFVGLGFVSHQLCWRTSRAVLRFLGSIAAIDISKSAPTGPAVGNCRKKNSRPCSGTI
jgi:hypothetical protein